MPPLLKEIRLQGFRAFRDLTLAPLTRINLLVGANNTGKTSVLEGAEILLGGGGPQFLARSLLRRMESVPVRIHPR
jgi:predicted ATP-dependent endonuclease of OLD family